DLGNIMMFMGRLDEAVESHREAVRLAPDAPNAHNDLAAALQANKRYDEAIAEYQEALRLYPEYPIAPPNLGILLPERGPPAEAMPHYEAAVQERSQLKGEGQEAVVREALTHFESIVRKTPESPEAHFGYATILSAAGRNSEAIDQLQTALQLRPD